MTTTNNSNQIRPRCQSDADFSSTEKLRYYLLEHPNRSYINCKVGPDKVSMRISKNCVKNHVSPELREIFEDKLDFVVVKFEKAENLDYLFFPYVDPTTFRIFKQILGDEKFECYLSFDLNPNELFDLISLSKTFGTKLYQKGFELLLRRTLEKPREFLKSWKFLNLSQKNLLTLLSEDWLVVEEVEIFKSVCKWAALESEMQSLRTKNNYFMDLRQVLGEIINEIRFASMSIEEFESVVRPACFLTFNEKSRISEYLKKCKKGRASFDSNSLGFKVTKRKKTMTSGTWVAARLLEENELELVGDKIMPKVSCGPWPVQNYRRMKPWLEVEVNCWAGPVDNFSALTMSVEPFICTQSEWKNSEWKSLGTSTKENQTKPGNTAYFGFKNLLTIEPQRNKNSVVECVVRYDLKGPTEIPKENLQDGAFEQGQNFKLIDYTRTKYEQSVQLSCIQYTY